MHTSNILIRNFEFETSKCENSKFRKHDHIAIKKNPCFSMLQFSVYVGPRTKSGF